MVNPDLLLSGQLLKKEERARLRKLLHVLSKTDLAHVPDGKYMIDGQNLFFFVQTFSPMGNDEPLFETHTVRADVQYLIRGTLIMDFCNSAVLSRPKDYDRKNDITFYEGSGDYTRISIPEREPVIIMPIHGHRTVFPKGAKIEEFRRVIGKLQLEGGHASI